MRGNKIASRDYLISARNFWIGLGLYTSLFVAAASSYGSIASGNHTGFAQQSNWTGTLIFGDSALLERNAGYKPKLSFQLHKRGALTLRRNRRNDLALSVQRSSGKPSPTHQIIFNIPDLPTSSTNVPSSGPITFSASSDSGLTAENIAMGTQSSFAGEEITPVPEPGTWFVGALVAAVIAWSQRRRFAVASDRSNWR